MTTLLEKFIIHSKKIILSVVLLSSMISLEATHYQSKMEVSPQKEDGTYLVNFVIEKIGDGSSSAEFLYSPHQVLCEKGEPSELFIGNEDDALDLHLMISEQVCQASCLIKEKGQNVFSFENVIQLKDH